MYPDSQPGAEFDPLGGAAPAPPADPGLLEQLLAARRRATALYDLSTLITSAHELAPIVELLLTKARQAFRADRAAVFLEGPDQRIRCLNAVGLSPAYLSAVLHSYDEVGGGLLHASERALVIPDAWADPAPGPLRALAGREGFHTLVLAPFLRQAAVVGMFALYHDTVTAYTPDDLAQLNTFANHVAVAFTNVRLFEATERQLRRSHFLAEAGRLLNSSLDLRQVLRALTQAAIEVLGEGCAIYLLRPNEDNLALAAYAEQDGAAARARRAFLETNTPRLGEPGIGHAAMRGELLLVTAPPRPGNSGDAYLDAMHATAYLVVPLLVQERLLGALVLWLFHPGHGFGADDMDLARELADRAAVALEHARLYERELRAQQIKDDFLASVSHELRTPLTAILGYTQLMRKSLEGESSRFSQQLDIIWSQAQRLRRLIETIVDISSLEQGRLALSLERLDLWPLVHRVLARLRTGMRSGLQFDVHQATPECWITGDPARLEQVFSHLLTNAVKYSPAPGAVQVTLAREDDRAVVCIRDRGPGMTASQLGELFQRYQQGDTPLNRTGGLGLGLFISRAIVEEHGGSITADSAPGDGTTFCVRLRAEPD